MGLLFSDKFYVTNNHHTSAPAYPQEIHEHRAPTDDSVKLLREMEEASRQSVVGSCKIEDNTLNGTIVVFLMDPQFFERTAYIRFKFNGKDFTIKKPLPKSFMFDKPAAVKMLAEAVRDQIMEDIFPDICKALLEHTRQVP